MTSDNNITKPIDDKLIKKEIDTAIAESKKGKSDNETAHILWLAQGIDIWHRTNGERGHSLEQAMYFIASTVIRQKFADRQKLLDWVEAEVVGSNDETSIREISRKLSMEESIYWRDRNQERNYLRAEQRTKLAQKRKELEL